MSGLAIHALTLGAVGMMLDLESVNKLLDVVIPCYTILVIIVIAAFVRHNKDQKEDVDAIPVYTWNKSKAPQVEIPWKDQLLGNWDLAAPRGEPFKKWLMFNGAPSFIASMNENNHTSMHIEKGETGDKMYTLAFKGTPVVNWTNNFVGDSNEQAKKGPQDNHKRYKLHMYSSMTLSNNSHPHVLRTPHCTGVIRQPLKAAQMCFIGLMKAINL